MNNTDLPHAKTLDIPCVGYSVKADIYEASDDGPVMLSLIGRTASRIYREFTMPAQDLTELQGITTVTFDYTGHGDSPFDLADLSPAQHFLEVITVFDWIREHFPNRKIIVGGSSYGGFHATQLTKYRKFDTLILRAPAIYRPSDFYTISSKEDRQATAELRRNVEELAVHPLLKRASKFKGDTLLVVHENDDTIPTETTDAYANAFSADVILQKDTPHPLGRLNEQQHKAYFEPIYKWIEQTV